MGTLERIRSTSPYLLGFFAVVLIGFFVISDLDPGSFVGQGNNPQTAVIATVNGEDILYKDFIAKAQERIDQQRSAPDANPEAIDEVQIRKDIFNEMVEQMILDQEAEKAGIFVSDEEILDIMIENPPDFLKRNFMDTTGTFNKQVYLEIVTNPNKLRDYLSASMPPEQIQEQIDNFNNDLLMIEGFLKQQKLSESLMNLVNSTETVLSPSYVEEKYLAQNATTGVNYIFFDVNSIPDADVNVTQEELKELYSEHKQYYETKPIARLKYVRFPLVPSSDDTTRAIKKVARIDQELQKGTTIVEKDSIFDIKLSEYSGETTEYQMIADIDPQITSILDTLEVLEVAGPINMGPKGVSFFRLDDKRSGENVVVKASHILIKLNDNQDSAKAEANKIMREAKSGDFAELATKYSQDPGSARSGGDLGYFGKGRMVKEFEDAAFAAKVGSVVGPVESQFGYHIIKVFEKKTDDLKYSEINIKPTITTGTTNKLYREAYALQRQAEEGVSFDTLVARLGMTASMTNYVTKDQPSLGSQFLTHKAFDAPTGTVLEPIELKQYGVVVAQVLDSRAGGIASFQDIEQQLREQLVHRKKLDMVADKAQAFYSKLSGISELTDAPQVDQTAEVKTVDAYKPETNIPGVGVDYGFATEAFKLPTGKINPPVRGSRGYYIIQVYNRNVPVVANLTSELYSFKTQLQRDLRQRAFYNWFGKVKQEAVIEDNRSTWYTDY